MNNRHEVTEQPDDRRDLVVIGASAGGLTALRTLVSQLPEDFPAAILVVVHIGTQPSILPSLLTAWGRLPAVHAEDGSELRPGLIQVAPPDHHLLLAEKGIRLSRGPKEHHSRPAIDPLFRSAAICCGTRVIGVILSGHLDDGTAGLQAIKACGGTAIVQEPRDAQVASMPLSVLRHVEVDHCLPTASMPRLLSALVAEPAPLGKFPAPDALRSEHAVTESKTARDAMRNLQAFSKPSTHSCPDCGGVLWEVDGAKPPRFRCHTGHAFTLLTLAESMREATEEALQTAIRALQEQAILRRRAAGMKQSAGEFADASAIDADADRLDEQMRLLVQISENTALRSLESAPLLADEVSPDTGDELPGAPPV
jgi:two-component system, chemotaxis family, protein-glutamate methylesterase/glutaminase